MSTSSSCELRFKLGRTESGVGSVRRIDLTGNVEEGIFSRCLDSGVEVYAAMGGEYVVVTLHCTVYC